MKSLIFKLFWKKSDFSAKKVWNQTFSTFLWKKVKSLKSLIDQTFLSQNQTFRSKKFENQTFSKIKLFWPKSLIFKLLKNLIAKKSLILFKKFKNQTFCQKKRFLKLSCTKFEKFNLPPPRFCVLYRGGAINRHT